MDTAFIIFYYLVFRLLLWCVGNRVSNPVPTYMLVVFVLFLAIGVPVPMVLIQKEIFSNTILNVCLSEFSFFYFALVSNKTLRKMNRS